MVDRAALPEVSKKSRLSDYLNTEALNGSVNEIIRRDNHDFSVSNRYYYCVLADRGLDVGSWRCAKALGDIRNRVLANHFVDARRFRDLQRSQYCSVGILRQWFRRFDIALRYRCFAH